MYPVKSSKWMRWFYPACTWSIETAKKELYLTFDDGPTPGVTDQVLDILKAHQAFGSFFCLGKNAQAHPELYQRIKQEGHQVGNHSYSHLNGWKSSNESYLQDVAKGAEIIPSSYFRPPYGKLKRAQRKRLLKSYEIILWDVLSGDFDPDCSKEKCLENVIDHSDKGSIIVFHDSNKAKEKMLYALPRVIEHFHNLGYQFLPLP